MDLSSARYFLAILDCGTFSGAARACHVSQPSVTVAIRRLEIEFGGKLFERTKAFGSRAAPTELANTIKPHLELMVMHADCAREAALKLNRAELLHPSATCHDVGRT